MSMMAQQLFNGWGVMLILSTIEEMNYLRNQIRQQEYL